MNSVLARVRAGFALGLPSLWRALSYRAGLKLGLNPVCRMRAALPDAGPFYVMPQKPGKAGLRANTAWHEHLAYFGWHRVAAEHPPPWHTNPFNGIKVAAPERPWWRIPDFDPQLGDIKTVWEASRFDWVLCFAQLAAQGEGAALAKLNRWLADWCSHNPAYCGPNWKCGQEASIRVMHLAFAALLMRQHRQAAAALQKLVEAHLKRIAPTIQYAIAQDNNHGTSEAAALFIGGSWLALLGEEEGRRWARTGRKWLENRAARLIEPDGSFSQYSVNYHRVMLDTYSMAEYWRREQDLPEFSPTLYRRLRNATHWLYHMVQMESGDAPNMGANDGARLLPLSDTDYRDFRPSVQLAMALFLGRRAYAGESDWNTPLQWLNIPIPRQLAEPPGWVQFGDGGYSLLRQENAFAVLRFPNFRFRPSQADALHVDLWVVGQNLLRDAGTYGYNAGDEITKYFSGTASHNTVQFDDRDQMPRLGRFLFGAWLKTTEVTPVRAQNGVVNAAAGYRDYLGADHHRSIELSSTQLMVRDRVSGFEHKAVLRWRLYPADWRVNGGEVTNGVHQLVVTSDVPIERMELTQGCESRYYLQKTQLPVIEIEIRQPGSLTTRFKFAA